MVHTEPCPQPCENPPKPQGSKWFWKLFQVNRSFRTLSSPQVLPKDSFVTKTSILSWRPKLGMQKKTEFTISAKICWTPFWWKIQHLFRDVDTTPYLQLDHRCKGISAPPNIHVEIGLLTDVSIGCYHFSTWTMVVSCFIIFIDISIETNACDLQSNKIVA